MKRLMKKNSNDSEEKFIYKKIYCSLDQNITIDIIENEVKYYSDNIRGTTLKQVMPGLYFVIKFDSYIDHSFYDPVKKSIIKKISGKIYVVEMHINVSLMKHNQVLSILLNHFVTMQKEDIYTKKNFRVHPHNISKFINNRNESYICLDSINQYLINDKYVYNFDNKKIMKKSDDIVPFIRKGGIIQTNCPIKIIDKFNPKKTLVIIPSNMTYLWKDTDATIYTFDDLLKFKKNNIHSITNKKWNQLVIHECHVQLVSGIRNLLKKIRCNTVWIINTLSLKYYFSMDEIPNKVDIIMFSKYLNLWMHRETIKQNLLRITKFVYSKLNIMYAKVHYPVTFIDNQINIKFSPYERILYGKLNDYYNNWKNKLSNDELNKYSFASKNRINLINQKLFNGTLMLSLATSQPDNAESYLKNKINNFMISIQDQQKQVDLGLKCISKTSNASIIEFFGNNILEKLNNIINDNNTILNNYTRYRNTTLCIGNDNCPICYEPLEDTKTNFICGHQVCFDCVFQILANNNECPICREHININKLTLINSIDNTNISEFQNLCKTFDLETVVLTNLSALQNISHPNIFNVNGNKIINQIKEITHIKKVVIITTQNIKIGRYMNDFLGYFSTFNKKPEIVEIMIN